MSLKCGDSIRGKIVESNFYKYFFEKPRGEIIDKTFENYKDNEYK